MNRMRWFLVGFVVVMGLSRCGSNDTFLQSANSDLFVQDYNPENLDILWVVDNRSPMNKVRTHLVSEARKLFVRLDSSVSRSYRMGFATADTRVSPGLQPASGPVILTKNYGTVDSRADLFSSFLSQVINLKVDGDDKGLESALYVIRNQLIPRAKVPMVLIFISDSDDHSTAFTGNPESYFATQYQAAVGNNPDLLRVYMINYKKTADGGTRCATSSASADIDRSDFQDRYFDVADLLAGEKADLCQNFADTIDLSGVRLKTLPSSFTLTHPITKVDSLQVTVLSGGVAVDIAWTYDATANAIVFASAPPEGAQIQVVYSK